MPRIITAKYHAACTRNSATVLDVKGQVTFHESMSVSLRDARYTVKLGDRRMPRHRQKVLSLLVATLVLPPIAYTKQVWLSCSGTFVSDGKESAWNPFLLFDATLGKLWKYEPSTETLNEVLNVTISGESVSWSSSGNFPVNSGTFKEDEVLDRRTLKYSSTLSGLINGKQVSSYSTSDCVKTEPQPVQKPVI